MEFISPTQLINALSNFKRFVVIDNFLLPDKAKILEEEFLEYSDPRWILYDNPVENKRTCNQWDAFKPATYKFFRELNSPEMLRILSFAFPVIYSDPGLHGGGLHMHGVGGNLNPHLDYEIHPKLGLKRKLNIIIYLSELNPQQGGKLGFWRDNGIKPGGLVQDIEIKFNRAVLFETERCWHGMSSPMANVPANVYRKSLAAYYLTTPAAGEQAGIKRAQFVARPGQKVSKTFLMNRSVWKYE